MTEGVRSRPAHRVLEEIETGATLATGTTVGVNEAIHTGNMSSELDAETLGSRPPGIFDRSAGGDRYRHIERDLLAAKYWYTFDEGGGDIVSDQTGVGSEYGELRDDVSWISDSRHGNGINSVSDFGDDGYEGYIPVHHSIGGNTGPLPSFTVCAWIRGERASTGSEVVLSYDDDEWFTFLFDDGGGFVKTLIAYESGGVEAIQAGTDSDVYDQQWHFIATSYDRNEDRCFVYVDGEIIADESVPGSFGYGERRFGVVGRRSNASSFDGDVRGSGFESQLDELRYYQHRALTKTTLDAIYNGNA